MRKFPEENQKNRTIVRSVEIASRAGRRNIMQVINLDKFQELLEMAPELTKKELLQTQIENKRTFNRLISAKSSAETMDIKTDTLLDIMKDITGYCSGEFFDERNSKMIMENVWSAVAGHTCLRVL